jgi:hypothetical protein
LVAFRNFYSYTSVALASPPKEPFSNALLPPKSHAGMNTNKFKASTRYSFAVMRRVHPTMPRIRATRTSYNAENKSDEDIRYGSHTTRVQKWMFVQRCYQFQEQVFAIAGLAG